MRRNRGLKSLKWLASHSSDVLLIFVFVQAGVEVFPPFEEHGVANELEPGSELQAAILERSLEFLCCDIFRISYFVLVNFEVDVGFDEHDVVDWNDWSGNVVYHARIPLTFVLAPFSVTWSHVVNSRQEVELVEWDLGRLDP